MHPSEEWEICVEQDYLEYLDQLDPDICPMSPQAFMYMAYRDWQFDQGEKYEPEYV